MTPTRIALDANEANVPHRVGSNIYAYKLLLELERQTRDSQEFSFVVYTATPPQRDFPKGREGWEYRVLPPSKLWTQWRFPLELFFHTKEYKLVLSLGHYGPRFSPIPSIVCVLDLAFLRFPDFFRTKDLYQLERWTEYSVKQARHVITISQNSKLDIIKEYGRAPEDISLVYPGVELLRDEVDKKIETVTLQKYGVTTGKYLVSVGTIQPRKNMINLIHAFEKMSDTAIRLVFVGKSGWLTSEFEETVAMSGAKERIVVTGFVSEAEKYALLRHAAGSVLVGFYEGFGIPVIESMGVGVVPVVANTGSLPEVVGDLGILVDPYSVDDIARGLREVVAKKVTHEDKERMAKKAAQFSWEESGKDLLLVIKKTIALL